MQNQTGKSSAFKIILWIGIGVFALLGLLFVIFLFSPDDETDVAQTDVAQSQTVEEKTEESAAPPAAESRDVNAISPGTGAKNATIMIYMNGSDLESEGGEACEDISEMLASGIGEKVNVIVQTMGTKKWHNYGISSKTAQTYRVKNGELNLIRDDLGQLDCTKPETLSEFVGFCKTNYPADRYMFIFWDHGGGPVYGFGLDEWQDEEESLTLADMHKAFSEHPDVHFDIIGMDCCIMGNLETCYALAPFCDFTLLSEDFESGLGWDYTEWMKRIESVPDLATPLLGKFIVDSVIEKNENDADGDSSCVALFNEAAIEKLFSAWVAYAYQNEEALLDTNFSRLHEARGRSGFWDLWDTDESDVTLSDYYISDILAITEGVDKDSEAAKNLLSALKSSIAYYGHTSDKNELTGMAVSLPYGDEEFYDQLTEVYGALGIDQNYIDWLGNFVSTDGTEDYYDYEEFENGWGGWSEYEEDYGGRQDHYEDYDDWAYDFEEDLWYLYEDDVLYMYDEDSDTTFYYDEDEDQVYAYDEKKDDWYAVDW